jgi:integrase
LWAGRASTASSSERRILNGEIRYLTTTEVWALVHAAQPGTYHELDQAMYLTAAMTGMRIGEIQALDWRGVDYAHARVRVRRTWDRKAKMFTTPKSRRSERAVPMPDAVAGALERLFRSQHPDAVEPDSDALVFADPLVGGPLVHERM